MRIHYKIFFCQTPKLNISSELSSNLLSMCVNWEISETQITLGTLKLQLIMVADDDCIALQPTIHKFNSLLSQVSK